MPLKVSVFLRAILQLYFFKWFKAKKHLACFVNLKLDAFTTKYYLDSKVISKVLTKFQYLFKYNFILKI